MVLLDLISVGLLVAGAVYYLVALVKWRRFTTGRTQASFEAYSDSPARRAFPILLLAAIAAGMLSTLSRALS